ncbi:MAG: hypothetical protein OXG35_33905 [Acidobacteria bacterium]|nr:hypothetical protein [Acidobacteriota bacterium]
MTPKTRADRQSVSGPTPGPNDDYSGWMMFQHTGPLYLPGLTAEQVDIRDILPSLGAMPRFNGQSRTPVTVLWHSLMVAEVCQDRRRARVLEALFHDAAEAYVGDLIRPLDRHAGQELKDLRTAIQARCFEAVGLPPLAKLSPSVKRADDLMLRYELQASWGFRRTASWHKPPTSDELCTVEKAMRLYGTPDANPGTADRLRLTFANLMHQLAGPKAPIRRSLEQVLRNHAQNTDEPQP